MPEPTGTDSGTGSDTGAGVLDDLASLAQDTAGQARAYLLTLREVSSGAAPESALPLLLLALTQVQAAGARLGAMVDVVPQERFEPDTGPDADLEEILTGLRGLFGDVDAFVDLADPLVSDERTSGSIAGDLTTVAADLAHGLGHYEQGNVVEGLWWWQYSYLSSWGERAAVATRGLLGLLSHVRLDVDAEVAMEASLEALHGDPADATPGAGPQGPRS